LRFFSKRFFLGEVAGLTQNPQPEGPGIQVETDVKKTTRETKEQMGR
jgi:hypothetical protein